MHFPEAFMAWKVGAVAFVLKVSIESEDVLAESRTVRMVPNHPVAIHGLRYRFDLAAPSSAV